MTTLAQGDTCRYEASRDELDCLDCERDECVEDGQQGQAGSRKLDLSTVSRADVAKVVNCVPEHIGAVFLGKTLPSLPLAYDIAQYLGTTIDELYKTITGANGTNPRRIIRKTQPRALPPKYTVEGKGYPNLGDALLAIGIVRHRPTHYDALSPEVRARIVRNRPFRGR
tara:strand:- start:1595 stop:2101 length:507 start_codon:yes stop_codon:yes gene_type:complete